MSLSHHILNWSILTARKHLVILSSWWHSRHNKTSGSAINWANFRVCRVPVLYFRTSFFCDVSSCIVPNELPVSRLTGIIGKQYHSKIVVTWVCNSISKSDIIRREGGMSRSLWIFVAKGDVGSEDHTVKRWTLFLLLHTSLSEEP